jgi:hypothetical protein
MKSKYLTLITFTLGSIIIATSCKKTELLDRKSEDLLNEQSTFTDSARTIAFLTGVYSEVGTFFNPGYHAAGGHAVIADEANAFRYNGTANSAQRIAQGLLDKADNDSRFLNMWAIPYKNIRAVNILLTNIDKAPLSNELKLTMKAEARFLRAYYYSLLLRAYGGVPIIGDKVYDIAESFDIARSTYQQCVDYIISELDAAKTNLPSDIEIRTQDYGRATSGACLALKARVLLYAASPLFNGGQYAAGGVIREITGYPAYDKERWKKALDALEAVINSGHYDLYDTGNGKGFYEVFLNSDLRTKSAPNEYIFAGMRPNNRDIELICMPNTKGGNYLLTVNQNMVDRFPMANGKPISDPTSGYDPANPYDGREPRFYYSILYNGAKWRTNSNTTPTPLWTYVGSGSDGVGANSAQQHSGYYSRKMCNTAVAGRSGSTRRHYALIRYAEIILSHAEALNEYYGATPAVYDDLKKIRQRAGIAPGSDNLYGIPAAMSQAEMRVFIQNERAIELFLEEHRMWDARRWKTAEVDFNKPIRGVKITKTGNKFDYEYVDVKNHFFHAQYGLFPIFEGEISKNKLLIQNPGW